MNKPNDLSLEHPQRTLPDKLRKACRVLQRFEQRMILISHRSDQIALKMQQIRKDIEHSMPGHTPSQ
ncbi:hypothetical protein [Endozoicomonas sp. GU-1]|uniref:hypothetical protein n=1 Tax=Endozoicomonas sp. GU-1 TaxID=3009078 RepID=UPI0022B588B2|nr:hypothetical protein [Endozoicomonas sp. GU-1]WBA83050.1 hypothetical protein O2T12_07980 [Endozoicomonas sp. GU-1]WBA85972.1 hypothetical protein O3276_22615 [Endozoicomonas sp. GU-1]